MAVVPLPPLPPGRWGIGVSGGADSVALLRLVHAGGGRPHVVHLDHETRGGASAADAAFVSELAGQLGLSVTVARRADVARADPPRNVSARYRQARFDLFRRVVAEHDLAGVLLAHHAADQAETVALRLLRGGGTRAVRGMSGRSAVGGVTVLRPLLAVRPATLRDYLRAIGQAWREDESNASADYLRNRLRPVVAGDLGDALIAVAESARGVVDWLDGRAPVLAESFGTTSLAVATPLARHAAGRWLVARGVPADAVSRAVCDRLVAMATDAATPSRQAYPGGVLVRRAGGVISVGPPPPGR